MQLEKQGIGCKTWCDIGIRKERAIKLIGTIQCFKNGKLIWEDKNAVLDAFKNETAKGAATGTCNAVDTGRFNFSDASDYVDNVSKYAGGTGEENYVTFEIEYKNTSGGSKTINSLDLGYDLGGGSEAIYCQKTGMTEVVVDNETIKYRWTITVVYSSGGVTAIYRQLIAKMVYTGLFLVPNKIRFVDTVPAHHVETASLEEGGTGAENYHQWTAQHEATGSYTIDIIILSQGNGEYEKYTEDDITDKSLEATEVIIAHVKIVHN